MACDKHLSLLPSSRQICYPKVAKEVSVSEFSSDAGRGRGGAGVRPHWVSHGVYSFRREGVSGTTQFPHGTDGVTETQLGKGHGQGQSKLGADSGLEPVFPNICLGFFLHLESGPREGGENPMLIFSTYYVTQGPVRAHTHTHIIDGILGLRLGPWS